jgi:hypothetical protein
VPEGVEIGHASKATPASGGPVGVSMASVGCEGPEQLAAASGYQLSIMVSAHLACWR